LITFFINHLLFCLGIITVKTIVRYFCIFYFKNAGLLHDDFWCLFFNMWVILSILVINGANWILPGKYSPTYEICSCISQDNTQPRKFENTAMALSLTTVLVFSFVAIQIKIYKRKLKLTVLPVAQSNSHKSLFTNKLLIDLTLTIGSVFLLSTLFFVVYILGSTNGKVDFNIVKYYYLLMGPIIFNLVTILFYAKNVNARKILLKELSFSFRSLYECNQ